MTTIFIGGSRAVSRIDKVIQERLDDFIGRGCMILLGDANGADKAVQRHLADRGYANVVVYCMDACRNNIGGWQTKRVSLSGAKKDFAYYSAKDLAMAQAAKCGVMLWDGKSKGTLNNIQNLIGAGKKALVYFAPNKAFYKLSSEHELHELLQRCDTGRIQEAQRQIKERAAIAHQPSLPSSHS